MEWRKTRVDVTFLQSVGRIRDTERTVGVVVEHPLLSAAVDAGLQCLERTPRQSFLITGESGTGKTALFNLLAARLAKAGWTIFEASAVDVLSGQVYIARSSGA